LYVYYINTCKQCYWELNDTRTRYLSNRYNTDNVDKYENKSTNQSEYMLHQNANLVTFIWFLLLLIWDVDGFDY